MLHHLKQAAAALLLRERAHLWLRLAPSAEKAHAAADVLLYDAAVSAALSASLDAALSRIAAPIVPPVREAPKAVPSSGDPVVDDLRREFPEWCTHRGNNTMISMHRDDREIVDLVEVAGHWYVSGDDRKAFTAIDAAEHATGLVRLSRRGVR